MSDQTPDPRLTEAIERALSDVAATAREDEHAAFAQAGVLQEYLRAAAGRAAKLRGRILADRKQRTGLSLAALADEFGFAGRARAGQLVKLGREPEDPAHPDPDQKGSQE